MACEIISNESAVFALWGRPSKADLDRVVERVELVASSAARRIVYVTRVPSAAPAPDTEVRAHMNALMPRLVTHCASYHVLLEGGGFVSAMKRCILAGLLQFGWKNGSFFVHQDVSEVLSKIDGSYRRDARAIIDLAARKGLLSAPPPADLETRLTL